MEPFGAASGAVGILGVTGPMIKGLYNFWSLVKDAPDMIKQLLSELECLELVLDDMVCLFATHKIQPTAAIDKATDDCVACLRVLEEWTGSIETKVKDNKLKQYWKSIKASVKDDELQKYLHNLERSKTTLSQAYRSKIDFEKHDMLKGVKPSIERLQAGQEECREMTSSMYDRIQELSAEREVTREMLRDICGKLDAGEKIQSPQPVSIEAASVADSEETLVGEPLGDERQMSISPVASEADDEKQWVLQGEERVRTSILHRYLAVIAVMTTTAEYVKQTVKAFGADDDESIYTNTSSSSTSSSITDKTPRKFVTTTKVAICPKTRLHHHGTIIYREETCRQACKGGEKVYDETKWRFEKLHVLPHKSEISEACIENDVKRINSLFFNNGEKFPCGDAEFTNDGSVAWHYKKKASLAKLFIELGVHFNSSEFYSPASDNSCKDDFKVHKVPQIA